MLLIAMTSQMMVSMFQLFSCYLRVLVEPPARNQKYNAICVLIWVSIGFILETHFTVGNLSNVPAFLYLLLFGFRRESEQPQPDSKHWELNQQVHYKSSFSVRFHIACPLFWFYSYPSWNEQVFKFIYFNSTCKEI